MPVVRRVCRELSTKKHTIILNDEAHCYHRKSDGEDEPLTADDSAEAKNLDEEAWEPS